MIHITKPSEIFDGKIDQLQSYVSYFKQNKDSLFEEPNNNLLMYWNTYEDSLIEFNFKLAKNISEFFSAATNMNLSNFKMDVLYMGGADPWTSVHNAQYPLVYKTV